MDVSALGHNEILPVDYAETPAARQQKTEAETQSRCSGRLWQSGLDLGEDWRPQTAATDAGRGTESLAPDATAEIEVEVEEGMTWQRLAR
jgi:hypothetical protein